MFIVEKIILNKRFADYFKQYNKKRNLKLRDAYSPEKSAEDLY